MSEPIIIDGHTYDLLDQIDNVAVVDSFVKRNKIGTGSGEARLYLGPQEGGDHNYAEFFGDFSAPAFFLKRDLEDYLTDAKFEYEEQSQGYQRDISADWSTYSQEVQALRDREDFSIHAALGAEDAARYYIRSHDEMWDLFRTVMLPWISYVTILKIRDAEGNTSFLFRPTLNYFYDKNHHPEKIREEEQKIEDDVSIPREKKMQLREARVGQGDYRRRLLKERSECVISKIDDERLLIASHIKPWSISSDTERLDHYNGLMLTPTYDRLFDQGFITFADDGTIEISPYISDVIIERLGLVAGTRYDIPNIDRRQPYLTYHRTNIFKR